VVVALLIVVVIVVVIERRPLEARRTVSMEDTDQILFRLTLGVCTKSHRYCRAPRT